MDAFRVIDFESKSWISTPQLKDFQQKFWMNTYKDDNYTWTSRFDKDSDGRMLYSDFCDAFTPKE